MIVQCKEEDVEKNGYTHTRWLTDRQKCNTLTQTSPRTGLGKNNNKLSLGLNLNTKILDGIKKKLAPADFSWTLPTILWTLLAT